MHWEYRIIHTRFRERNLADGSSVQKENFTLAQVQFDHEGIPRNFETQIDLQRAPTIVQLEAHVDDLKDAFTRPFLRVHGNQLKEVHDT